jgi:hypothetical protein
LSRLAGHIPDTATYHLIESFLGVNDYPHREGSWPHSAETIERQMGRLSDGSRAKILGPNAARLFGLSPT